MIMQETVVREPEVQVARRPAHAPEVQAVKPPPLESGDRLTRREFERRYHAMPRVKKAELIEGGVYIASPARSSHSQAHAQIMGRLGTYAAFSPGVEAANSASVRLDLDNEVQPDALLRLTVGGTVAGQRG